MRPCIALAGQVLVGSREMRALGVESAYSLVDLVGEERAFADPAGALADLAERVATNLVTLRRARERTTGSRAAGITRGVRRLGRVQHHIPYMHPSILGSHP